MTTIIEMFVNKMGLSDEPHIVEKTTELVRLLELRSANVPLQVNEYGKIALCADIAATLLNLPFEKEHAVKLSALKKTHYANNKRVFEKLLDLNKIVGVNEICIQLNINEVSSKATELLELYKNIVLKENNDIDIKHPQYAAMAVFYACKLTKKKVSKSKIMPFSNLKPSQWQQLEQRWERIISKHYNNSMQNKLIQQNTTDLDDIEAAKAKIKQQNRSSHPKKESVEDYENWKARMLEMAKTKLQLQQSQQTNVSNTVEDEETAKELDDLDEKENMILGL